MHARGLNVVIIIEQIPNGQHTNNYYIIYTLQYMWFIKISQLIEI